YQERAAGRRPRQAPGKHPAGPGVREWLAALPEAAGRRRAAAFDTRLTTLFPGSAARLIARSLEDHGYEVITRPEGFLVETMLGPRPRGPRRPPAMSPVKHVCPGQRIARLPSPEPYTRLCPPRPAGRRGFRQGPARRGELADISRR